MYWWVKKSRFSLPRWAMLTNSVLAVILQKLISANNKDQLHMFTVSVLYIGCKLHESSTLFFIAAPPSSRLVACTKRWQACIDLMINFCIGCHANNTTVALLDSILASSKVPTYELYSLFKIIINCLLISLLFEYQKIWH